MSEVDPFEDSPREPKVPDDALIIDVEGFEGPLDLLLALARQEKIDLMKIQILPLAEQYLAFVERAKALRIELAADFLVMAAWLAWLKSRLIAPADDKDAETGEELAEDLAFRLRRLDAMRIAAAGLMKRPHLGEDIFARGMPERVAVQTETVWNASLFDLLSAYGNVRQQEIVRTMTMEKRPVFSLVDARRIMERLIGPKSEWMPLSLLVSAMPRSEDRRSLTASAFGAALEMAREGRISVRQSAPFAPLYIRGNPDG